jgi:hypothetical protein
MFGPNCAIGQDQQLYLFTDGQITNLFENESVKLMVYPNPVRSSNQLFFKGMEGKCRFRIFTLDGKLVADQVLTLNLDGSYYTLPELMEGIYFYSLESDKSFKSGKLYVQE